MSESEQLEAQRDAMYERQRARAKRALQTLYAASECEVITDSFDEARAFNALWLAGLCEKYVRAGPRNSWKINEAGRAAAIANPAKPRTKEHPR